jgi:hypothetical protein
MQVATRQVLLEGLGLIEGLGSVEDSPMQVAPRQVVADTHPQSRHPLTRGWMDGSTLFKHSHASIHSIRQD